MRRTCHHAHGRRRRPESTAPSRHGLRPKKNITPHSLRHYPESRNIPSQIGGARAGGAFRSIVEGWLSAYCMRLESTQKREKLVIRSKASDSSGLWIHSIEGGLLHLEVGIKIYLRRLD